MSTKISNTEWGLLIGAALTVDFVQFLLDILVIGLGLNPFIDVAMGMSVPFYFTMRGQKMTQGRIGTLITTFFLELIPGMDDLPLWSADIVLMMLMSKAEEKAKKLKESPLGKNSSAHPPLPRENKKIRDFSSSRENVEEGDTDEYQKAA
jgi:hypothetical protein